MRLLLILVFSTFALALASQGLERDLDGPYIDYLRGHDRYKVEWVDRTNGGAYRIKGSNPLAKLPPFKGFHPQSVDVNRSFERESTVAYTDVDTLAVISDIHGQYEVARRLLILHGIMDDAENWTFGRGHLVIVGDVFDRGDQVTPTLWLIYHLQQSAAAVGGRVHFLLGNHETMVLEHDLRYVNPTYLATARKLGMPYYKLFNEHTFLGKWLRTLPLSIKINDAVYVHGGFSREVVHQMGGLAKLNDVYHDYLVGHRAQMAAWHSKKLNLLHGRRGPLWYRGYFDRRQFTADDIDEILASLDARRIIVGHTSFDAIKRYFGDRIIAVDSSIKFGSMGEVLLITNGIYKRGTLTGEVLELEPIQ